ncbi:MAG: hypothetical protein LBP68_04580 [Acidobacteriota bacterium]|jgi:hypothetical protein|nr:hypothetical protein [Acidobacteriota bacterium]
MTKPMDAATEPELLWERGWSGHEDAQLLRLARLPLSEKLAWLEEMHHLVNRLAAQGKGPETAEG